MFLTSYLAHFWTRSSFFEIPSIKRFVNAGVKFVPRFRRNSMSYPSYMCSYLVHVAIRPYKVDPGPHPVAIKDYKVDPVLHLSLPFLFYLKHLKLHTRVFLVSTHPSTFFCSYIHICWCAFICCCITVCTSRRT